MKSQVILKFEFEFETTDLNKADIEAIRRCFHRSAEISKARLNPLSNFNIEFKEAHKLYQKPNSSWIDYNTHDSIYHNKGDMKERDDYINNHPDKEYFDYITK